MLTLKGGVKSMGKSMSSILKKIEQITIKMGNQAMQESPISMIMCCFCMTPAYAGNTEYDTLCMINEYGTKTFNALNHSDNTKTSKNVDWYMKVNSLTFNVSTDGTLGMAFTPLRNSQTVGAEVAWYKKANTSYKYYSWNNNGECGKYKLGARLDTLITNGYGHGKGYWNAY